MPNQVEIYPVELIIDPDDNSNISLHPCNDKANDVLKDYFLQHNALATVAITQTDASRDGYDSANQPYSDLLLTISA